MKHRNRKRYMLNLFSLALLAIALYLNFIKNDTTEVSAPMKFKNAESAQSNGETTSLPSDHTVQNFVLK